MILILVRFCFKFRWFCFISDQYITNITNEAAINHFCGCFGMQKQLINRSVQIYVANCFAANMLLCTTSCYKIT